MGASACTEPFLKRGGGGAGAGIVRTSIGTVTDRILNANATTSLATPVIPANAFLLVAATYNTASVVGQIDPVLVTAGITLTLAQQCFFGTDNVTYVWYRYGGGLAADTLRWNWPNPPTSPDFAAFACYVTGLGGTVDFNAFNAAAGTTQNSSAIGVITAPAYGFGAIGTDGRSTDTVGTWDDGAIGQPPNVSAVANAGTANLGGVQIKVGELIIAANQQMSLGVTGATSRNFGAITQALR